ncbi:MAG: putative Ig domain-containing protein [Pseudomonadota bacterium]
MSRAHSPDKRSAVPDLRAVLAVTCALASPLAYSHVAPTISGTPSTSVAPGTTYYFRPNAYDADGDTLRFSIANKPAWASFSRRSGRLSGTPTVVVTHSNIVISVSDGTHVARLAPFGITVANPAPVVAAPTISGTPSTSARVGQVYSFTPTARDPAGLPLTFSIANKPYWATFAPATGTLSGTPGAGDVGTYSNITISTSNGTRSAALAPFAIGVQAASLGAATITWQPPTTRTDGTPLTNLTGYRIYYGTTQGGYPNQVPVANPGLTSFVVENLPPGTYWFVVTALDGNGIESVVSSATSKLVY